MIKTREEFSKMSESERDKLIKKRKSEIKYTEDNGSKMRKMRS